MTAIVQVGKHHHATQRDVTPQMMTHVLDNVRWTNVVTREYGADAASVKVVCVTFSKRKKYITFCNAIFIVIAFVDVDGANVDRMNCASFSVFSRYDFIKHLNVPCNCCRCYNFAANVRSDCVEWWSVFVSIYEHTHAHTHTHTHSHRMRRSHGWLSIWQKWTNKMPSHAWTTNCLLYYCLRLSHEVCGYTRTQSCIIFSTVPSRTHYIVCCHTAHRRTNFDAIRLHTPNTASHCPLDAGVALSLLSTPWPALRRFHCCRRCCLSSSDTHIRLHCHINTVLCARLRLFFMLPQHPSNSNNGEYFSSLLPLNRLSTSQAPSISSLFLFSSLPRLLPPPPLSPSLSRCEDPSS